MLRSAQHILSYQLSAIDGQIGHCADFLFDDHEWTIRYMVANTGDWLPGRKTLIAPFQLGTADWETKLFSVKLTRQKIEESPPIGKDAPVSRQMESLWYEHHGDGAYWDKRSRIPDVELITVPPAAKSRAERPFSPNLRSMMEVTGYRISASDGSIGHVEDFVLDDEDWRIRYMVVDVRDWLPGGKKVIVSPEWIVAIGWAGKSVSVDLSRESVRNSPEFDASQPVNREYELRLYDFYGKRFTRNKP